MVAQPASGNPADTVPHATPPADTKINDGTGDAQSLAEKRQNLGRLWRLFWTLAKPFWRYSPGAKANLVWVVFLGVLQSVITVVFSYVARDFWTALQKKDDKMFWQQVMLFTVLLAVSVPVIVWYSFEKDRLALRWRRWHTRKLLGEYFSERNYYCIGNTGTIDNVDQRIADDTAAFTSTSLALFMTIFMSALDLVNFSVILVTIYPQLFVVLLGYAGLGTFIAFAIGRRLISLNFTQLQREADFRFSMIRVRENAECIAFCGGEGREHNKVAHSFDLVVANMLDLIRWSRNLAFFTTTYSYFIQILPLAVIAPIYFGGSIELGVVSQSQQAFRHVLDDLSIIISQFESLSAFSAGIDRLGELEEFLFERYRENAIRRAHTRSGDGLVVTDKQLADEFSPDLESSDSEQAGADAARFLRSTMYSDETAAKEAAELLVGEESNFPSTIETIINDLDDEDPNSPLIHVKDMDLMTPGGERMLIAKMNMKFSRQTRFLIVGESGAGKSSLLRALAGLWTTGHGSVKRPGFKDLLFIPQRPYCPVGTLREQLVYPRKVSDLAVTDEQLHDALARVGLEALPERVGGLDATRGWSNLLSLGEQQRLAFARVLILKPAVAFLDESTSALDLSTEERLYKELLRNRQVYISVGHRPSLANFHDLRIIVRPMFPGRQGTNVCFFMQ